MADELDAPAPEWWTCPNCGERVRQFGPVIADHQCPPWVEGSTRADENPWPGPQQGVC